ncbi:heparinase II/III family protein [Thermomonas sp. S9]|uniref:heparinase II/III family protein n=1 Tax=Thermomonas sp. S9 TaxID=2885203 RepID=UPI00216B356E|nr:heparinase II/III family protein [Thermomonas sp. S9]
MAGRNVLARYWHTLRWLRPVQWYGRAWHLLYRPTPDLRPAPALALPPGRWQPCARVPSLLGPEVFRFLSVERRVVAAADWNRADWPRLWLYNAHYFDDLVADGAEARTEWHRALIARWIAENPPGQGNGWEPYPTSLRIVNWLKWLLAGHAPVPGMRDSLAVQVRWLRRRLEHHLLGNHLWANAKALVFAGVCFDGDEAARWRREGLRLLQRELREQVLADGGHFERSPMYHAILTEDVLDLLQLSRSFDVLGAEASRWQEAAVRMLDWATSMAHPDGDVAFFNDAAFGIAPPLPALQAYAAGLGLALPPLPSSGLHLLQTSGYARMQAGPALLLADVAPVGPDYLPGHAHADTLSFELSLHGRRVLVNGGTSTYENNAERQRQRGTAAHNTVVVDGADSSEVWAAFRVARRARVHDIQRRGRMACYPCRPGTTAICACRGGYAIDGSGICKRDHYR